jgi:hypothetical protein
MTSRQSGFTIGVVYLVASAVDQSLTIDVDPVSVEIGYFHNFARR